MANLVNWLRKFMLPGKRRHRRDYFEQETTLSIGLLEERRVFHAGTVVPPAATTLVTTDSSNNMVVSDVVSSGRNDRILASLNATGDRLELFDRTATIYTDIPGATGSLTNRVSVPLAAILGSRITFDTLSGDDAVLFDFTNGVPGKAVDFQGGTGHDAIRIAGGTWNDVSFVMTHPKDISFTGTNAQGTTQISWTDLEEVDDVTQAISKTWRSTSNDNLTLLDNGDPNDNILTLLAGFESYINFAQPTQNLTFVTQGGADIIHGFNSNTPLNLVWNGATNNRFIMDGELNLNGGNFNASFGELMFINGSVISTGGNVTYDAQNTGELLYRGQIDVSNTASGGVGGNVYLLGKYVTAFSESGANASGDAGGGSIVIGGREGGVAGSQSHPLKTVLEENVNFVADAITSGNGGTIVVWSEDSTYALGTDGLSARGGTVSGDGGLIITAAQRVLQVGDAPNASATNGNAGTWLIQARDIVVESINPATLGPNGQLLPSIENTIVPAATISAALNSGTSVSLAARAGGGQEGNITVNQPISVNTPGNPVLLALTADKDVDINSPISSTNRTMSVNAFAFGDLRNGPNGSISVRPGVGYIQLTAGGVIGDAPLPLSVEGGLLTSFSTGEQHFISPRRVDVLNINAGNATTFLAGGQFNLQNGTASALIVENTATLSGSGTIQSLLAQAGSTIQPGDGIGSIGVFNILGVLQLETGSTLRLDINPQYVTAGVDYDQLIVGSQLFINSATLQLDGGVEEVKAIKPMIIINLLNNMVAPVGRFANSQGSIDDTGEVHVGVVITRVNYNGNDGNDVILRNTNVVPAWGAMRQPDPILRPVVEQRTPPLPLLSASVSAGRALEEAPPRETDAKQIRVRVLVISRLVPNASGKGFQEQQLLRLNEEWLKNLADVFRRLPDDRYRVTLLLEGGESRRVMDVIIRDGKPFETETAEPEESNPANTAPKANSSQHLPQDVRPLWRWVARSTEETPRYADK